MKKAIGLLAALAISGCATQADVKARDAVIKGMCDTGDAVDGDCLAPNLTPGQKAEVDSWRLQRKYGHAFTDPK